MPASKTLRHVVLFGFKPEAPVDQVVERFCALKLEITDVDEFEWGVDVSPEGLGQGHTHCFTLTFATASARDGYLIHPRHQEFVAWVGPFIEKALVVDYWAETGARK